MGTDIRVSGIHTLHLKLYQFLTGKVKKILRIALQPNCLKLMVRKRLVHTRCFQKRFAQQACQRATPVLNFEQNPSLQLKRAS